MVFVIDSYAHTSHLSFYAGFLNSLIFLRNTHLFRTDGRNKKTDILPRGEMLQIHTTLQRFAWSIP